MDNHRVLFGRWWLGQLSDEELDHGNNYSHWVSYYVFPDQQCQHSGQLNCLVVMMGSRLWQCFGHLEEAFACVEQDKDSNNLFEQGWCLDLRMLEWGYEE